MVDRVVAVIPARLESTRLPSKMILEAGGRPLIWHTVQAVKACTRFDRVVVATDSPEIAKAVDGSAPVITTYPANSGTERIASIANSLRADLIVNVQGDEPEIKPEHLDALIDSVKLIPGCDMATLATALQEDEGEDGNVVKVRRLNGFATWFFRHSNCLEATRRHIGVYVYTPAFLKWFVSQPPSRSEQQYRLEQMRAMDAGCRIRVTVVDHPYHSIDTAEQFEAFAARVAGRGLALECARS